MPRHAKLPEPLAYLQPFANRLSRLPADELHEDLDAEPLIAAIRKHFDPNDPAAAARFRSEVTQLEDWLQTSGGPAHPAHWIAGFLATCELQDLFEDIPEAPAPTVEMACPAGWKIEMSPASLCLRKRGLIASFTAIDHEGWEFLRHQWQVTRHTPPPDPAAVLRLIEQLQAQVPESQRPNLTLVTPPRIEATDEYTEVRFGDVFGLRHARTQTSPFPWKTVSYLLTAPGGRLTGQISTLKPGSFDEAPIESVLPTLRVIPPT